MHTNLIIVSWDSWRALPRGRLVDEEVHGPDPGGGGEDDEDARNDGDPLAVPQLHDDVKPVKDVDC